MSLTCSRCSNVTNKLVEFGDVDTTAWHSIESRVATLVYDSICVSCALKLLNITLDDISTESIPIPEETNLIEQIEAQKSLMVAVATGGSRIQERNQEYKDRRKYIRAKLFFYVGQGN